MFCHDTSLSPGSAAAGLHERCEVRKTTVDADFPPIASAGSSDSGTFSIFSVLFAKQVDSVL